MRVTLTFSGIPFEFPVGPGDSISNIVQLVLDQTGEYKLEEVQKWSLTDADGNVVSFQSVVSDLSAKSSIKLFLEPKVDNGSVT